MESHEVISDDRNDLPVRTEERQVSGTGNTAREVKILDDHITGCRVPSTDLAIPCHKQCLAVGSEGEQAY
jgi:hypothetical protein